ncbi:MAG: SDR family NAD(P)-dependent oxidoreductase [Thermomicrobiales bacterium]
MFRFDGKTGIVTGGARGIGRAIAERLSRDGARIMVADIDETTAQTTASDLGDQVIAQQMDVTSDSSWNAAVERALSVWDKIDILINNAGIAGRSATVWDYTVEEWNQVIGIDLTGVFLGCRAVVPRMIEAGYGRIVNISSVAGKEGNPNAAPYSAAKAGVIGLTKSLAKEVATKGILVNAITPAPIETEILKQISQEHINYMLSRIPMGRIGQPEEVATLVAFLASDEVTFSTGAVFDISGGRTTY